MNATAPLTAGQPFAPWFDPAELDADTAQNFERRGSALVPVGPGFFSVRGRLAFVLPRPWSGQPTVHPAEPLLTLRTLTRYAQASQQRAVSQQALSLSAAGINHAGDALQSVENALLLWKDARENGPLWLSEHRSGPREQGRTHWARTMSRTQALPLRHTTIHPAPIRARHRLDVQSPLTRVHAQATAEVRERLGAGPGPLHPIGRTQARRILDGYAHKVFSDRMKRVFPLLRRHFSPHHGFRRQDAAQQTSSLFASRFEYVWEAILAVALGPRAQTPTFRGRYWRNAADALPASHGARLLPDLIFDVDLGDGQSTPYRVVVDAKHYRPEHPPGTESIVKQMVYRHLLSQSFDLGPDGLPAERIGNTFILPEVLPGATLARVLYIHELDGERPRGANSFGRIVVLGVNLVEAQRAYVAGRASAALRRTVGRLVAEGMRGLQASGHPAPS